MVRFPEMLLFSRVFLSFFLALAAALISRISNYKYFFAIVTAGEFFAIKIMIMVALTHTNPNVLIQSLGMISLIGIIFSMPNIWKIKLIMVISLFISFFVSIWFSAAPSGSDDFAPAVVFAVFLTLILGLYSFNTEKYYRHEFLEKERAQAECSTDFLTQSKTRSYFYAEGSKLLELCKRKASPCAVAFFDVNQMKFINDTYGHDSGDLVLKTFSKIVSENIRGHDMFARLGGDEFALFLPFTDWSEASGLIARLSEQIALNLVVKGHNITCSVGLAVSGANSTLESLLQEADKNMYADKKKHRAEADSL